MLFLKCLKHLLTFRFFFFRPLTPPGSIGLPKTHPENSGCSSDFPEIYITPRNLSSTSSQDSQHVEYTAGSMQVPMWRNRLGDSSGCAQSNHIFNAYTSLLLLYSSPQILVTNLFWPANSQSPGFKDLEPRADTSCEFPGLSAIQEY